MGSKRALQGVILNKNFDYVKDVGGAEPKPGESQKPPGLFLEHR